MLTGLFGQMGVKATIKPSRDLTPDDLGGNNGELAFGPVAGLELVDALVAELSLRGYDLLPSVRGDLLTKVGRYDEARGEFEHAAALTRNTRERELLFERALGMRSRLEVARVTMMDDDCGGPSRR
jgi:hypothetical protein